MSDLYKHKKRGTVYELIGIGKMQATGWISFQGYFSGKGGSVDMLEVAIYRSATDPAEIWVRPLEEFQDGRFEQISNEAKPL